MLGYKAWANETKEIKQTKSKNKTTKKQKSAGSTRIKEQVG